MKLSLKTLVDPEKAALARARFHAWWEGEAFDPMTFAAARRGSVEAVDAAVEGQGPSEPPPSEAPPPDPRLTALQILWGGHRLMPGEAAEDRLQPARLGLPATGTLAILGPGLAGPVLASAEAHPGTILAYEWREEAVPHVRHLLSGLGDRARVESLDLDLFAVPSDAWDGAWSLDEFSYAPNPSRLAVQIAKGLKPGASVIIECYAVEGRFSASSAFASAFAEPHLLEAGALKAVLSIAGLGLEDAEDLTQAHLLAAKEGFRRLEQALSLMASQGFEAGVAREIAWEAEGWAHRMSALHVGKLTRRRFVFRKPD
jgi:hypothetical protein